MRIMKKYAKTALCMALSAAMLFMDMGVSVSATEYPQEEVQQETYEVQDENSVEESSVSVETQESVMTQNETQEPEVTGTETASEETTGAGQNEEATDAAEEETITGEFSTETIPAEMGPETEIESEQDPVETQTGESSPETVTETESVEIPAEESSPEAVTESQLETEISGEETVNQLAFSDTDIAHGEYKENGNDITWTISVDGKLTVEGKGNFLKDCTDEDNYSPTRKLPTWYKYRDSIVTAEINVTGMTDASCMFIGCEKLTSLDLSNFDTSKVTNMEAMFKGGVSLTSLDLSNFDTSKVTNMCSMFECCRSLTNLDLSNFDTSKVTNMDYMFDDCEKLKYLDLSSFDASNVTTAHWMFIECYCLEKLYTPRNMKYEGTNLGGTVGDWYTMYDMAGNVYEYLPTNREDSILLLSSTTQEAVTAHITAAKVKRTYVCGETLNTDDITVRYYGTDGSVKDLAQTDYTTNAAEIDMSIEGEKTLTVTYNDMKAEIKLTVSKKAEISDDDEDDSPYTEQERTDLTAINAVIANIKSKTYDGCAYVPTVKVTATVDGRKKTTLMEGTDYRVMYQANTDAGEGKVIVKGNGLYKGEIEKTFTILPKSVKKLKIVTGSITGTVNEKSASDVIFVYDGTKLLTPETDYEVSAPHPVGNRKDTVQVTIKGKGNYSGTSSSKKLKVYDAQTQIIQPENVTLDKTSVPYTGKAIQSKDIKVTVKVNGKELNPKTDYKVQYQNNKNAGTAYVIVTGKKAYKGMAIVPFTITAETVQNPDDFKIKEIKAVTYNGKPQKPSVNVTIKKNGKTKKLSKRDYIVTYKNNLHAGTAKVIVTGTGNYAGLSATSVFTIKPQQMKKVSLKGTQNNLILTYSRKRLKEGTDYESPVYGIANRNKVKVTIMGKGDFTGKLEKTIKVK